MGVSWVSFSKRAAIRSAFSSFWIGGWPNGAVPKASCRSPIAHRDERGSRASEGTWPAELRQAWLVNPHDIDGMKDTIVAAAHMDPKEKRRRMRRLRRKVMGDDVAKWSKSFLGVLTAMPSRDTHV